MTLSTWCFFIYRMSKVIFYIPIIIFNFIPIIIFTGSFILSLIQFATSNIKSCSSKFRLSQLSKTINKSLSLLWTNSRIKQFNVKSKSSWNESIFSTSIDLYFSLSELSKLNAPFFKDHDFVIIENSVTGEKIYIDPTTSDYLGIDEVAVRL
mgnify:CR=1 FL=1